MSFTNFTWSILEYLEPNDFLVDARHERVDVSLLAFARSKNDRLTYQIFKDKYQMFFCWYYIVKKNNVAMFQIFKQGC